MKYLGLWIRTYRIVRLLTQDDLAYQLDVDVRTVRRWESGENMPTFDNLKALCKIFDVSLDQLWFVLGSSLAGENALPDDLSKAYAYYNAWTEQYKKSNHPPVP